MRIENPIIRRAQRVLAMVNELHKQGYHNLGIYTGMSSSGMHWRCYLTHCSDLYIELETHNVKLINYAGDTHYTTGDTGDCYFGWDDAKQDSARQLATKFIDRFPRLIEKCKGYNPEYIGWFTYVLGISETGVLPVMFRDYYEAKKGIIRTTDMNIDIYIPPYKILTKANIRKNTP